MANIQSGNTFYVDSASDASIVQSYVSIAPTLVTEIIFTSNAVGDSVVLCDLSPQGSPAAGGNKMTIKNGAANDSKIVRMEANPAMFSNGVWVASISSGATATLIGISKGSG